MSTIFDKFLLIAALLGLWSGPVQGQDWKADSTEKGEWAIVWTTFAVLEGVRTEMVKVEESIADGSLDEGALGFRLLGAGMLLASVPDLLFEELKGPGAAWQPMAKGQYLALREVLTEREGVGDPLAYLHGLPTGKMFTALNLQMMAHGEFSSLEIDQLRDTLARAFEEQQ